MNTIGDKIDAMFALREERRVHEAQIKGIQEKMDVLEQELIGQMEQEGVKKTSTPRASVNLTTSVKPSVKDWDKFYAFIHRHKYYHLLERRPAVLGCRELFETKGVIPGVEPYTAKVIQLRAINEEVK